MYQNKHYQNKHIMDIFGNDTPFSRTYDENSNWYRLRTDSYVYSVAVA